MKIFIGKEFSCSFNYQSHIIINELAEHFKITTDVTDADIIVFPATCSGSEYHILSTLNYINSILKDKKNGAKVYLTGCITRKFNNHPRLLEVEKWLKENIDFIIPQNQPYLLLKLISENYFGNNDINDFGMIEPHTKDKASIYISNGCRNNCSFCKVTFQKYPLKSVNINELKEGIDYLNEEKISQIWLQGTNICQYGLDIYHEYMLPEIINYLEAKENIKQVTLVGFAFKDAIRNNFQKSLKNSTKVTKLCGSLESGSNRLLEMMRKGFTSEEIIQFVKTIRQNNHKDLRLNIISGFPTENIEDIKRTLTVLKELKPLVVDICRYTNSQFVDSNQFQQLSPTDIQTHTRIYSRALKKENIKITLNDNE